MDTLTYIYLFRMVDGKKVRHRFTLSEDRVITEEIPMPGEEVPSSIAGVEAVRGANGEVRVLSVSPEAQRVLSFFTEAPCWFPECEDLRQKYKAELKAQGTDNCVDCRNGPIIRKYQALVSAALQKAR